MPEIITGIRSGAVINVSRKVVDMSDRIALLEPSAAPLTVLIKRLNKKVAINYHYNWLEDELMPRIVTSSTAYDSTATTIVLTTGHGEYCIARNLLVVPRTGETMLVSTVSTDTLTVVRSWGAAPAAPINALEELMIIGVVVPQALETTISLKSTKTVTVSNYTQIFRTPLGVAGTLEACELYGGNDRAYQRLKKGIEHLEQIERAFLYGEKRVEVVGGHHRTTTGGAREFIITRIKDFGEYATSSEFHLWLKDLFRYGSTQKAFMCSPLWLSAISEWAMGKIHMTPTEKTFGIAVANYVTPHGTLALIKNNVLEGATYSGYAFAFDVTNLAYRYLSGRDTVLKTNIQSPEADLLKDEYLSEVGFELRLEKTHGIAKGITSI